jgi:hypothetical protein
MDNVQDLVRTQGDGLERKSLLPVAANRNEPKKHHRSVLVRGRRDRFVEDRGIPRLENRALAGSQSCKHRIFSDAFHRFRK